MIYKIKYLILDPKSSDLTMIRCKDRTGVRCKVLGRIVVRSEIQIELGYSWFSAKFVLANCLLLFLVGIALNIYVGSILLLISDI